MKRHRVIAYPCSTGLVASANDRRSRNRGRSRSRGCCIHLLFDDKDDVGLGSATVLFDYLCAAASFRLLSGCFPLSSLRLPLGLASADLTALWLWVHGDGNIVIFPFFFFSPCSLLLYFPLTLTLPHCLSLSYFSALVESFTVESLVSLALGAPACLGFHFRHVAVTLSNGDCIANDAIVFGGNESGFVWRLALEPTTEYTHTYTYVCVGVCTPDPRADASKGSEVNEVEEKCKLKKKKKTMRQLLIRLDSPVELPNGSSCHLKSRTRVQLTFELYTKVIAVWRAFYNQL